MKLAASLFLGLSTLMVSSAAQACSFSPIAFSGLEDYSVYDSDKLGALRYKGMNVALIKTKKLKSLSPNSDKIFWDDPELPNILYELRLEVIDVLQGSFPEDETIIVPKMSDEDKKEFQLRLNRNTGFNFWDGFQLTRQASNWYGDMTSCGPHGEIVLENDQYYLIGRTNTQVRFLEPVSGPDDSLVQAIKNLVNDNEDSPLKIDVRSFLSNIDGYIVFDVMACPPPRRENSTDIPLRYRYSHLQRDDYDEFDHIYGVVEETPNAAKLKPQNFMLREECKIGDRFLVLEKQYADVLLRSWRVMDLPKHRYMQITNGKIDMTDIPTNYEFTGETIIPVEQVKAWIREGGAASDTGE